jgi:hypothetical protein
MTELELSLGTARGDTLADLGLPEAGEKAVSSGRQFPDGGSYRLEIPSVEGPEPLEAIIAESRRLGVPVHRVSQGSGVMMLDDEEIRSMLSLCAEASLELCLFLGPRASWDISAGRFTADGAAGARAIGRKQLSQCLADAQRAVELGVRCLLVADEGVLWSLHQLRARGELPNDLTLKVSALSGPVNPASFQVLESLGADSINVAGDLTVLQIAELRSAAAAAIDIYLESPDNIGGFVRHYEAPELVRVGAPVYLKFGLRNAPELYPVGRHLREAALHSAVERVRRGHLCLQLMDRLGARPEISPPGSRLISTQQRFIVGDQDEQPHTSGAWSTTAT